MPPLLFFTDPDRTPEPWKTAARLPQGAGVVYRHFGRDDAEETATRLRQVTEAHGVKLLIGLDADLAETVSADGVHLPERNLDQAPSLRRASPRWLITGAFHEGSTIAPEVVEAIDALVVSPVFTTGSASPARAPLGRAGVARLSGILPVPVYALGGVNGATAAGLAGSGACGLAGVEAVSRAFGEASDAIRT